MDENPYKAPEGDFAAGQRPESRRYLAAALSLMGLGGSGFFLYYTCVGVWIAANKLPSGFIPVDCFVLFFVFCPMSAASWLVTAWSIWRRDHRILAASIFIDASLIASVIYGL